MKTHVIFLLVFTYEHKAENWKQRWKLAQSHFKAISTVIPEQVETQATGRTAHHCLCYLLNFRLDWNEHTLSFTLGSGIALS